MKRRVLYRKRRFLNKLGHHSGAHIFAEILKESWTHKNKKTKRKTLHTHRYTTLSISDCSRIIDLDFELDHVQSGRNGLKKLNILINTLNEFKEVFEEELKVIEGRKNKKYMGTPLNDV